MRKNRNTTVIWVSLHNPLIWVLTVTPKTSCYTSLIGPDYLFMLGPFTSSESLKGVADLLSQGAISNGLNQEHQGSRSHTGWVTGSVGVGFLSTDKPAPIKIQEIVFHRALLPRPEVGGSGFAKP